MTFQGYKTVRYCRGEKRKTKTEVSSTAENLQREKTASEKQIRSCDWQWESWEGFFLQHRNCEDDGEKQKLSCPRGPHPRLMSARRDQAAWAKQGKYHRPLVSSVIISPLYSVKQHDDFCINWKTWFRRYANVYRHSVKKFIGI